LPCQIIDNIDIRKLVVYT